VPGDPPRDPDPAQPSLFDLLLAGTRSDPPLSARDGARHDRGSATVADQRTAALADQLRALDVNAMTPLEALNQLARLREELCTD
jgi:hypothetical protein